MRFLWFAVYSVLCQRSQAVLSVALLQCTSSSVHICALIDASCYVQCALPDIAGSLECYIVIVHIIICAAGTEVSCSLRVIAFNYYIHTVF